MLKIALSGSTGLIGTRIIELLQSDFTFVPLLQSKVDIADEEKTNEAIQEMDFDLFLHMAAYTNVDGAEMEKEIAYKVNVEGTKNIFEVVAAKKKQFIYISTDFVFDGSKPPYYENSQPNPVGYYAQTKYEAEEMVKNQAMIVRLSYPYRARFDQKKDFVRSLASLLESKHELKMVTDSLMTPTFIDDIVFGLRYCFTHFSPQIIHLVGSDSVSPFNAAKLIAKNFGLDGCLISPTTFAEYSLNKSKRPQYSEIKTINNTFYKMKSFEEGLIEVKNQLRNF